MKVLYCSWYENSQEDLENALNKITDEVIVIEHKVREYLGIDESVRQEIISIVENGIDMIISFDFFPALSQICESYNIKYVSWVYDWPNYTLFHKEAYNKCNRIFLFERDGVKLLSQYNINNVYYSSLAVDIDRLDLQLGTDISNTEYEYDVSFVGNMNSNLNNILMLDEIPQYYEGYINGLAQAQQKIYGYNIVNEIINDEFVGEYLKAVCADMDNFVIPHKHILSSQINKYITGMERVNLLKTIANEYNLDVFTGNDNLAIPKAIIHKSIDYYSEMPRVFRKSRINLNVTLRSITSDIPLRVYDILGAGGFCLTNYQEDIVQLFKAGEELVVFTNKDDMFNKVEYYLSHEKERLEIALNGREAVKKFSYENVLKYILNY